ncbi:MAG: VWA domain-containing protein, partial [Gammaproteobacteria bacterium]|nr:VWA domain-containing protein [Gammaproteobacteria bacterium]
YVTRVTDLSTDIDTVYSTLLDYHAAGGGDAPESVNAALYDAVHAISWSEDPSAYRVIFLVGDSPPHMDYDNEPQYPETARLAAERGIVINAILCGDNAQTESRWREIADLAQGRYFTVGQQGDAVAIDTPYDRRIAELSAGLDDTRLYYGSPDVLVLANRKVAAADKLNREASAASRARRAAFNLTTSGAKSHYGDGELVEDVADGSVSLADIAEPELPAVMRPMDAGERAAYLKSQTEQRGRLNRELRELVAKRTAFVAARAKAREGIEASLDHRIFDAVREQAGAKGFRYTDAAPAL